MTFSLAGWAKRMKRKAPQAGVHYAIYDERGRTSRRHLTGDEVAKYKADGYGAMTPEQVADYVRHFDTKPTKALVEVDKYIPMPNRAELRHKGLRAQRTGKPHVRIPSGTPTGKGSLFTHQEQVYKDSSGKKQRIRYAKPKV